MEIIIEYGHSTEFLNVREYQISCNCNMFVTCYKLKTDKYAKIQV